MKEKLLTLLVAKFAGVSKATLERIAEKKAGSVSDENQLQSIADSIDYGQILQSDVDAKITASNQKAIQNYENKYKIKDGKPITDPKPGPNPNPDPTDIKSIISAAVSEAVKPLQEKIENYEAKQTKETLTSQVLDKVRGGFENEADKKLFDAWFDGRNVEIETAEEVDSVAEKISSGYTSFKQKQVDSGVVIDIPVESSGSSTDSESLAKEISEGTKEIVEQQKK